MGMDSELPFSTEILIALGKYGVFFSRLDKTISIAIGLFGDFRESVLNKWMENKPTGEKFELLKALIKSRTFQINEDDTLDKDIDADWVTKTLSGVDDKIQERNRLIHWDYKEHPNDGKSAISLKKKFSIGEPETYNADRLNTSAEEIKKLEVALQRITISILSIVPTRTLRQSSSPNNSPAPSAEDH